MAESSAQLFRTVRVSRASHDIVQQIKESIFAGKLAPGDRLPSEKELAEQFGLSRITVRDALRVLESQGLIAIKVGAGGGAFVTNPSSKPLSNMFSDMLRLQGGTIRELVEARHVIETSIVTFAAERATAQDLEAMRRAIAAARAARTAGESRFTPYSVDFHLAMAKAAKNQVLLFTVNSLQTFFHETLDRLLPDDRMAQRAIDDHQRLLNAIEAHDAELATEVMQEHLAYFEKRVQKLDRSRI